MEISTAIGDKFGIANSNGNLGGAYRCLGDYEKAIEYYETGLKISTAIGDKPGIAKKEGNLGKTYWYIGKNDVALSYLERSIRLFDRIFWDMVPDQSKLSYTDEYFQFHKVSMACFLAIENPMAALLVTDHGRAKELHFFLHKQRNDLKMGMVEYVRSYWDRIEAEEEEGEMKDLEIILQKEGHSTTVLFFAFGLGKILHVWILNKNLIHKKLDVNFDFLDSLITGLLEKFNVSLARDF